MNLDFALKRYILFYMYELDSLYNKCWEIIH